ISIDDLSSKLHIYAESQRNQRRPVSFERPSFEALIAVDWDFLEQILDQLIDNAFSLGPPGVHVEISLMLDGTSAIISVANNGTRFDGSISPFKLGQSTRKRGKHGGIGLYMVRRFSEAFGGQVDAKNTEAGAVVVIQFPLANPSR
ncbi:MAG: ATP-binding protein, partial [Betaproteobacteria bacterium]|nr:ATP-binding protein [Betaproteobacteria bacterium]